MLNRYEITEKEFRELKIVFMPYEKAVREFALEKLLVVEKFYHDFPAWFIGKIQRPEDLDVLWWDIQFGYDIDSEEFYINVGAWLDTQHSTAEGKIHERRLVDDPVKTNISFWKKGEDVGIEELLELAYQKAILFTEKDLNRVSASIEGLDGVHRHYKDEKQF